MKKIVCCFCAVMLIITSFTLSVCASEIAPCYTNVDEVESSISISSTGLLRVENSYTGFSSSTKSAIITT